MHKILLFQGGSPEAAVDSIFRWYGFCLRQLVSMKLGIRIKALRKAKGFTQEVVCQRAQGKINISTLKRIEANQDINPTWSTLETIRTSMGIPFEEWIFKVLREEHEPSVNDSSTPQIDASTAVPKFCFL